MTLPARIVVTVFLIGAPWFAGSTQQTAPATTTPATTQSGTPEQPPATTGAGQAANSSQPQANSPSTSQQVPAAQGAGESTGPKQTDKQLAGSIAGTVVDQAGALAVGAHVELAHGDQYPKQEVLSGDNGEFSFADVVPGPFQLTIAAPGFQTKVVSGVLNPGQAHIVPKIVLTVAAATTEVRVGLTEAEIAEVQVKEQEKQRVLGIIPNFYVNYFPDAAPLAPKQKFILAWKSVTDPVTIVGVAAFAGIDQAADRWGGYGQGAAGYARRFGATYGDVFIGTFIDSAVLTSLLKQDPRYFYRGPGTKRRIWYAIGNAVITKGDNKRYQPNYSAIIGSFATSGITYAYYPANDRSAGLLVENAMIRIATGSLAGIFQEYVLRRFTSHAPPNPPTKP